MRYSVFEELPVWQAATDFALKLFAFTRKADLRGLGDLKNQLERSALSISNNIAEGFERGTTTELIQFLYIAKGSAGETRSMLRILERTDASSDLKFEISDLIERSKVISRQLKGWLDSLKNSDIRGVKFLNEKERKRQEEKKELAEFDAEMDRYREELNARLARQTADSISKLKDG